VEWRKENFRRASWFQPMIQTVIFPVLFGD
jgi:hypothetical protein